MYQPNELEIYNVLNYFISDISQEELESYIITSLQTLSPLCNRVLLSLLADTEFTTCNNEILSLVLPYVRSIDKRIAQTSSSFLLICSGIKGQGLLNDLLLEGDIPHTSLIKGIISLLT